MVGKLIGIIYFYFISVISIILMIIGVFAVVNYFVNTSQYEKYPLKYGNEVCDTTSALNYEPVKMSNGTTETVKVDEVKQKILCEKRMEMERKKTKLEDIKNAITFPLVGIILFLIHFPQARKLSREK